MIPVLNTGVVDDAALGTPKPWIQFGVDVTDTAERWIELRHDTGVIEPEAHR